jgi:hypothetical protein
MQSWGRDAKKDQRNFKRFEPRIDDFEEEEKDDDYDNEQIYGHDYYYKNVNVILLSSHVEIFILT